MAVRVVDLFQKVYVNQQERTRHVVASPSFYFLPERRAKAAAVRQARQVIAVGLGAQAIHRLLERDQLRRARHEQGLFGRHGDIIERAGGQSGSASGSAAVDYISM